MNSLKKAHQQVRFLCIKFLVYIILTKSERGEEVEGRPKSKFRPFVETKDDNGNPIRFGEKFKENPSRNDLSPAAVAKIKKLTFRDAGNAAENRKKVREIKKTKIKMARL